MKNMILEPKNNMNATEYSKNGVTLIHNIDTAQLTLKTKTVLYGDQEIKITWDNALTLKSLIDSLFNDVLKEKEEANK